MPRTLPCLALHLAVVRSSPTYRTIVSIATISTPSGMYSINSWVATNSICYQQINIVTAGLICLGLVDAKAAAAAADACCCGCYTRPPPPPFSALVRELCIYVRAVPTTCCFLEVSYYTLKDSGSNIALCGFLPTFGGESTSCKEAKLDENWRAKGELNRTIDWSNCA